MKNIYLIAYDITNTKFRTKVAAQLIVAGFDRIQYSVFMGSTTDKILLEFIAWYQKNSVIFVSPTDSLIVLPISNHHMAAMQVFGTSDIDAQQMLGLRNTLYLWDKDPPCDLLQT
jgi:CRISPR-associated endonuclease Cas2